MTEINPLCGDCPYLEYKHYHSLPHRSEWYWWCHEYSVKLINHSGVRKAKLCTRKESEMTETLEEKIAEIIDGNCYKETCPLSYMRPCSRGCSYTKAQQIKDLIISQGRMKCPNPECHDGEVTQWDSQEGWEDVDCPTCHGAGEVPVELKRISPELM